MSNQEKLVNRTKDIIRKDKALRSNSEFVRNFLTIKSDLEDLGVTVHSSFSDRDGKFCQIVILEVAQNQVETTLSVLQQAEITLPDQTEYDSAQELVGLVLGNDAFYTKKRFLLYSGNPLDETDTDQLVIK